MKNNRSKRTVKRLLRDLDSRLYLPTSSWFAQIGGALKQAYDAGRRAHIAELARQKREAKG